MTGFTMSDNTRMDRAGSCTRRIRISRRSLAAELTALEGASIESIVTQHPDPDSLDEFGLEHPSSVMLLYTRDFVSRGSTRRARKTDA